MLQKRCDMVWTAEQPSGSAVSNTEHIWYVDGILQSFWVSDQGLVIWEITLNM